MGKWFFQPRKYIYFNGESRASSCLSPACPVMLDIPPPPLRRAYDLKITLEEAAAERM